MRSSLTQALTRSRREFQMLAQALGAVAATRIALRLLPLARVRRTVRWMLSAGKPLPSGRCCSELEVIRAVVSAGKHCPGSTCLAVALVGQAMLSRHGYTSRLRVGVRRGEAGAFAAHAWLERDGRILLGGSAPVIASYTPMPEMEHLIQ